MITEPWFWVVIAFVLAALAALAIWKNGGIDVLIGPKGLVFKTHPPKQAVAPRGKREAAAVDRVAEGANIQGRLGEIVGYEGPAEHAATSPNAEVAKHATIGKAASVDKIVGRRIRPADEKAQ